MSPISTARLNPDDTPFCLSPPKNHVLVPILLNNTNVAALRYSLTPLGYIEGQAGTGSVEYIDVSARELKAVETARLAALQQLIRPSSSSSSPSNTKDEWEDEDGEDDEDGAGDGNGGVKSNLQKTQSIAHIRLSKPGTIRLERVLDASGVEARVAYPAEVTVVPCPTANFAHAPTTGKKTAAVEEEETRCAGDDRDLELSIQIAGVPPLSLRWYKEVNGKIERSLVEGIEAAEHGNGNGNNGSSDKKTKKRDVFERLDVPLTVSLDVVGRHTYVLETVMDAYGNLVNVGGSDSVSSSANSPSVRSLQVLRRPSVSFKHCGPGRPASLLVGKETPLVISTMDTDGKDAPWDVEVQYKPFTLDDEGDKAKTNKQALKPWKNTIHTERGNQDVQVTASAPGEYTIVGIKGKVRLYFFYISEGNLLNDSALGL
jgi:nucleoporin POM152